MLTVKSPWPTVSKTTLMFPPVTGGTCAVPVAPAAGATLAKYVPLPPVARNWNVLPVLQAVVPPPTGNSVGTIASGTVGGLVPTTLSTVGGVNKVRPPASVIANVSPTKQVPFGATENPPPLVR